MSLNRNHNIVCVVPASGVGLRSGGVLPKQYVQLFEDGSSSLRRVASMLCSHELINGVCIAVHSEHMLLYKKCVKGLDLLPHAIGGVHRQESVYQALLSMEYMKPDIVIVHDAARPFVEPRMISELVECIVSDAHEAATLALPLLDSVKSRVSNQTLDRNSMYLTQTPQAFRYDKLLSLHEKYRGRGVEDDAALFMLEGIEVATLTGSRRNIKITTNEDIELVRLMKNANSEFRVGSGYDIHRLEEAGEDDESYIVICGVQVPCAKRIVAHSDGDVAMHALFDAIAGALGMGDIGEHFPDSDPKWRGVGSHVFLQKALELCTTSGMRINNVDITIIAQSPRISPYKAQMAKNIADILGISLSRASIKATTHERLGALGREEGIAAMATVSLIA